MSANGDKMIKAVTEAVVNAVTISALTLGILILGKQSGQLASDIGLEFIIMQATAVGFLRFATYMYANEEDVTPGKALEKMLPTGGSSKEQAALKSFFRKHPVGKLI